MILKHIHYRNIKMKCENLEQLLIIEREIIIKHIDKHKWYIKEPDLNKAVIDFNDKYGWLMRDIYCGYMCEYNNICNNYKKKR